MEILRNHISSIRLLFTVLNADFDDSKNDLKVPAEVLAAFNNLEGLHDESEASKANRTIIKNWLSQPV